MKKNDGDINELINNDDFTEVIKIVAHNDRQVLYEQGPLNKNPETKFFESFVQAILSKNPKDYKFFIEDNKIYVDPKDGGTKINLSDVLENVNFNHLNFTKTDIENYVRIINEVENSPIETEKYFRDKIREAKQEQSWDALDYGEIAAINRYTANDYVLINALLRGQTDGIEENLPITIITAAIASHGLNKVPDVILPEVIRKEQSYNNIVQENIKNAKNHSVTQQKAFISTSLSSQSFQDTNKHDVKIIYKNVKGKDISAISDNGGGNFDEKEYLVPPCQVKWTGYKEVDGKHIFTAEGANVLFNKELNEVHEGTGESKSISEIETLAKEKSKALEGKPLSSYKIKEFIKKSLEIFAKHGVINEEEKKNYEATQLEQDARKFKSDHLRFKDKFLHALSVVTKTLGLTSITNSLEARVNESSQKTLSNLERQVFEIKRGINNSTSQQPHSDASVVQKDKKHVKQPKKGGGISLQ